MFMYNIYVAFHAKKEDFITNVVLLKPIMFTDCKWLLNMPFIYYFLGAGNVWFSLTNTTYQNNSIVTLEDIGGGNHALLCVTNLTTCCRSVDDFPSIAKGNWYFPNGCKVPGSTVERNFFRDRGQRVVKLNHRGGGEEGIYRCEIPDSRNVSQTIYIGVYTGDTGE